MTFLSYLNSHENWDEVAIIRSPLVSHGISELSPYNSVAVRESEFDFITVCTPVYLTFSY